MCISFNLYTLLIPTKKKKSSSNGHDWKKYRQSLNKLLQPDVVASYVPRIDAVALDWVALIEDQVDSNGNIIELREFINRFTSEG